MIREVTTIIRREVIEARQRQPENPLKMMNQKAAGIGLNIANKISQMSEKQMSESPKKKHLLTPPTPESSFDLSNIEEVPEMVVVPMKTPTHKRKQARIEPRTPKEKRLRKKI